MVVDYCWRWGREAAAHSWRPDTDCMRLGWGGWRLRDYSQEEQVQMQSGAGSRGMVGVKEHSHTDVVAEYAVSGIVTCQRFPVGMPSSGIGEVHVHVRNPEVEPARNIVRETTGVRRASAATEACHRGQEPQCTV